MSIKNKTESDERKETGKRFQELVRNAILYSLNLRSLGSHTMTLHPVRLVDMVKTSN